MSNSSIFLAIAAIIIIAGAIGITYQTKKTAQRATPSPSTIAITSTTPTPTPSPNTPDSSGVVLPTFTWQPQSTTINESHGHLPLANTPRPTLHATKLPVLHTPTPTPTPTVNNNNNDSISIDFLDLPSSVHSDQSFTITWRINGPSGTQGDDTKLTINYDVSKNTDNSQSSASNHTSNSFGSFTTPATFSTNVSYGGESGTIYITATATVNGQTISEQRTVELIS